MYTFQMIGLYLIVSVGPQASSGPQAPSTIVKVGSFRTTDDCLDASKAAVFGKNVTGSEVQKSVDFMCIPEASQRSWGVANAGPPPLVVRRLN